LHGISSKRSKSEHLRISQVGLSSQLDH